MNSNDREAEKGEIEIIPGEEDGELELSETQEEDSETQDEAVSESEELQQKYLRLAADFENYKKRLEKEKSDIRDYGNEELIKALLNVLDNLERALEHADQENDGEGLLEGVKLVHKQFVSCLDKFGVTSVEASKGTEFDPRFHQAIERVDSNELSSGLILSQMLPGYMLRDRLLRPALVVVSKGVDEAQSNGSA